MAPLKGAAHRASSRPPSSKRVLVFLTAGFAVGLGAGTVFMGTTHAILETQGAVHYGQDAINGGSGRVHQEGRKLGAGGGGGGGGAGLGLFLKELEPKQQQQQQRGGAPPKESIHTLCTGNGSPYQNYQLRIAYATYKLTQAMPGGDRLVAFTRILHRTRADHAALMEEIDTFRADPLQPACDAWCEYPVSDRANAVRQFFEAADRDTSLIKGEWIYMVESDYVFMKPLQLPDAASQAKFQAWGYPFDYIKPHLFPAEMKRLYPGSLNDIPGSGPAPFLMRVADWRKVTPEWERLTAFVEADPELVKKLGWVREMYAFSAATATLGIKTELYTQATSPFIAQLPIDETLGNAHAFHYTQCTIWKTLADDQDVWKYDKRFHTSLEDSLSVPAIDTPPAFQPGKWKTIEGKPISEGLHTAVEQMVGQMNAGIATLKPLPAKKRRR